MEAHLQTVSAFLTPIFSNQHVQFSFMAIGLLVVFSYVWNFVSGIWARLLRPGKNLKRSGAWAVITGATDGIGLSMAEEFARKGKPLRVYLCVCIDLLLSVCTRRLSQL